MNRVSTIILFSFLLFSQNKIFPQDFSGDIPYRHYTIKDGLAGSCVMSFLQDKSGYIWFATSNGLSRFDGNEFKNYSTVDGLGTNNLTGLAQSNDTIIISSYDKGLYYIKNNLVHNYNVKNKKGPFIHHLAKFGNHLFEYWNYLYDISGDSLSDISPEFKLLSNPKVGDYITSIEALKNDNFILCSSKGLFEYKNKKLYNLNIKGVKEGTVFTCAYKTTDSKILLSGQGSIWLLNNDRITKLFSEFYISKDRSISHIFIDDFNNLWYSEANSGLFVIKNSKIYDLGIKLDLEKTQINFIKCDREGNIWVGTFGKGVYCFFNLSVTNYASSQRLRNNYIMAITSSDKNQILIGTFHGLFSYNNGNFTSIKTGFRGTYSYIRGIQYLRNGTFYITGSFDMSKNRNSKVSIIKNNKAYYKILGAAACYVINEDSVIIGGWKSNLSVAKIKGTSLINYSSIKLSYNENNVYRINRIFKDIENNIWIGSAGGLCSLKNGRQYYFNDNPILTSDISDIEQGPDSTIWIAGAAGVAVWRNDKWSNYIKISGYDLTSSKAIAFDNEGNTWIANEKGLYRFSNDEVVKCDEEFGLNSKEINTVYFDQGNHELWIGTNEGLYKIDLNIYDRYKSLTPLVRLEYLVVNDSTYYTFTNLKFSLNINKITFRFAGICFRNPGSLLYQYKINKEDNWTFSESPEVQCATLSPGRYDIYIRAKSLNSKWSDPVKVSFLISTPFTKSYWFYSLLVLCIVVPAIFITRSVIDKKHRKVEEKKAIENKILELRQHALSAMMNPHFVFNSLNSIQNFINKHNKTEANNYLTKFAKLIRQNLDSAQEAFISLQDEVDRLNLYLSLEKMRFGENFSYSITIDDNIDKKETLLPNMIIQPFVENAIWHGILPNSKEGNLEIKFANHDTGNLVVCIVDDGIGFTKNADFNKLDHKPRGISIIKERLELLNKDRGLEHILNIKSGEQGGTIVEIILPLITHQSIIGRIN